VSGILVLGRSGQVGTELQRLAEVTAVGRDRCDLASPDACAAIIESHAASAVINAAAYTAVDRAEKEEALAQAINGAAPGAMAAACAKRGTPFIHISTDYVFDGNGDTPWAPTAPPAPQSAYGRTKLAGEEAVRAAGGCHAILRTSWVFSAHGSNFVKTMLRLSESRARLNVVADQVGGPTPARAIAEACLQIADQLIDAPSKAGTYHFSGAPDVSWYDFARAIFAEAGKDVAIHPIPTSDYPTPAPRPLNSRLDCGSTEKTFGIARPDWHSALREIIKHLEEER
jgi:dTDP-4-dehydrorhamnose reductase